MTLTVGDFCALAGLLVVFVGGPVAVMVNWFNTLVQRVAAVEDRVTDLSKAKVDKKEWVRESLNTRAKVDAVHIAVERMDSKIEAQVSLSGAVAGLAASIGELARGKNHE